MRVISCLGSNFMIMNPAKILKKLKTLEEALKESLEIQDFDEEAPDYDPQF